MKNADYQWLSSGKRLHNYGRSHHFQFTNPRFRLGPFSIVMKKIPEGKMEKVNGETERVTLGLFAEQRHQLCAGYQCKVKTTAS